MKWTYDKDADVMYITFGKPLPCGSREHEQGVVLRYRGKKLNGVTIVDYSRRTTDKKIKTQNERV